MTPTITDDDKGTITATVDGKVVRSWSYHAASALGLAPEGLPRTLALIKAREYAEGWHNCTNYLKSQLKTGETP